MNLSTYIINGTKFKSKKGFYKYVEELFTENLNWKIGSNLDAFDDILDGGFGKHDLGDKIIVKWLNYKKSEERLESKFLEYVVEILTDKESVTFEKYDYQEPN
jgi:Barstar (barnase inhibitor).